MIQGKEKGKGYTDTRKNKEEEKKNVNINKELGLVKEDNGCYILPEDKAYLDEVVTRDQPVRWNCDKKDLVFQVLDWNEVNTLPPGKTWWDKDSDSESSESEYNEDDEFGDDDDDGASFREVQKERRKYLIRVYGVTEDGKSVSVQVTGFRPYFFVKVPEWYKKEHVKYFENYIKKKCVGKPYQTSKDQRPISYAKNIVTCRLIKQEDLYGFTDHKKFKFIYVAFNNSNALYSCAELFKRRMTKTVPTGQNLKGGAPEMMDKELIKFNKKITIPGIKNGKAVQYSLYESGIKPLLRMNHIQDLETAGWIRIKKGTYTKNKRSISKCQLDMCTEWQNVKKEDKGSKMAPYIIASFDIECCSGDGCSFPQAKNPSDECFQIGTTINKFGENECFLRHIVTLKRSAPIQGTVVENYDSEKKLLLGWAKFINRLDPDIITGFNIWGFDMEYLYERAKLLNIEKEFCTLLNRVTGIPGRYDVRKLESSALGENWLKVIKTEGRLQIDMLKLVQRDHKLSSYKLDNVASTFLMGKVKKLTSCPMNEESKKCSEGKNIIKIGGGKLNLNKLDDVDYIEKKQNKIKWFDEPIPGTSVIETDSVLGPKVGNYLRFNDNKGNEYNHGQKFRILSVDITSKKFLVVGIPELEMKEKSYAWGLAKDDLTPNQLFAEYKEGTTKGIKRIAVYCVQDCELCNKLMDKLKIVSSNVGMANVCSVPMSYLFTRGQGIKVYSLVAKYCRENGTLIPDLDTLEKNESYEGAIVLPPDRGIHQEPVTVLDYSSLYPSSMISENISHDTEVTDPTYDNLPDYDYIDIKYDLFANDPNDKRKHPEKIKVGTKTVRYAQAKNGEKGIVPKLLMRLLKARKTIKKKINFQDFYLNEPFMTDNGKVFEDKIQGLWLKDEDPEKEKERDFYLIFLEDWSKIKVPKKIVDKLMASYNDFEKELLDGLQLAYKLTCNSVYGQVGASTSNICRKNLAASTTATGRNLILFARDFTLKHIPGTECTYGDTDSIMVKYPLNYDLKKLKPKLLKLLEKIKGMKEYQDLFEKYKKEHFKDTDKKIHNYFDLLPDIDLEDCKLPRGQKLQGHEMVEYAVTLGQLNEALIQPFLKPPHVLEYEKTFFPFILFGKKRYENYKYEFDPHKLKRNFMGTELKRRDNSDIVKDIYGGVVDRILDDGGKTKSAKIFFKNKVKKLLDGEVELKKLVLSKALKSEDRYANPDSQAHVVLARRMKERDPGSAPQANDRVPYIFIETEYQKGKKMNQGDRVEHPDFINSNKNIKPDYLHYLNDQVLRPVMRVFALEKLMNDNKGVSTPDPYSLIEDLVVTYRNKRDKQKQISDYFKVTKRTGTGTGSKSKYNWKDFLPDDNDFADCNDYSPF